MIFLYDLDIDELTALMAEWGQPAFRARQIWRWLYTQKVASIDEMTNLPAVLQSRLAAETRLTALEPARELYSTDGQTVKWLFRLADGQLIETVLMDYADDRHTACISTQAGCAMGCVFCATGQMGFTRHLSPGEIIEQAIVLGRWLEARHERLSNVVLMGMGSRCITTTMCWKRSTV
jgi:23S rRNA (adenine2503-C2)-methyltransferase